MFTPHFYFRPLTAVGAIGRLLRDPDRTEEAFLLVRALDAGAIDRIFDRFAASEEGARMLDERPSLLEHLSDRDALAALPEGSLGREYVAFCEREGITPGALVEASQDPLRDRLSEPHRYVADRLRDSHDLWHVIVGARTDVFGELAILAFSAPQTQNLGLRAISLAGVLRSFGVPGPLGATARRLVHAGWRRGRRARWLIDVPWERWLELPLDEVRARLKIEPLRDYARAPADIFAIAA